MLQVLACSAVQEEERIGIQIGKKEVKITVENSVIFEYIKFSGICYKLLHLKGKFNKAYNTRLICGNCFCFYSVAMSN